MHQNQNKNYFWCKATPEPNGLVHCNNCEALMLRENEDYICPNNRAQTKPHCPTTPINAQHMFSRVIPSMVKRVTTDAVLDQMVRTVREMTKPAKEIQEERLRQAQSKMAELNQLRAELLESVEQNGSTYAASRVKQIDQTSIGLAYQATVAQKELDTLEFITQEEGIRETAKDPRTYLGDANPADVRELLELMIKDIRVSPSTALIIYSDSMPNGENDQTALD